MDIELVNKLTKRINAFEGCLLLDLFVWFLTDVVSGMRNPGDHAALRRPIGVWHQSTARAFKSTQSKPFSCRSRGTSMPYFCAAPQQFEHTSNVLFRSHGDASTRSCA